MIDQRKTYDYDKVFGKYIKELRVRKGLTLSQVAKALGVSINYISQMERGLRKATDSLISKFSKLYQIDEDILFWKSGRIPLSTLNIMRESPVLQKAFLQVKKSEVSKDEWVKLEQELLNTFADFLGVPKEELLK